MTIIGEKGRGSSSPSPGGGASPGPFKQLINKKTNLAELHVGALLHTFCVFTPLEADFVCGVGLLEYAKKHKRLFYGSEESDSVGCLL